MSATVRRTGKISQPSVARIKAGWPVRGVDWTAMAEVANSLRGMPRILVPAMHAPATINAGNTGTFQFYWYNDGAAFRRIWTIQFGNQGDRISGAVNGQSFRFSNGPFSLRINEAHGSTQGIELVELEITIDGSSDNASVVSIECKQAPRWELDVGSPVLGVDQATLDQGKSIVERDDGESLIAVELLMDALKDHLRRVLVSWSSTAATALFTSSTTYVSAMDTPATVLERSIDGTTTRDVDVRVRASGEGTVRLTASSGDSVELSFNTGGALETESGTLTIEAEDLSQTAGLPGGSGWEEISVDYRSDSGAGLTLRSFAVIGA